MASSNSQNDSNINIPDLIALLACLAEGHSFLKLLNDYAKRDKTFDTYCKRIGPEITRLEDDISKTTSTLGLDISKKFGNAIDLARKGDLTGLRQLSAQLMQTMPKEQAAQQKPLPANTLAPTVTPSFYTPPNTEISMRRSNIPGTDDTALWVAIRNSTDNISFNRYKEFMNDVMFGNRLNSDTRPYKAIAPSNTDNLNRSMPFSGVEPYRLLKTATEVFLMAYCGTHMTINPGKSLIPHANEEANISDYPSGENLKALPYLDLIRKKLGDQSIIKTQGGDKDETDKLYGILQEKLTKPCFIELIWNYWMEEGMLVQTINAITMRFQNRRGAGDRDPLANLELDPLRPLNGYLWGYLQDEQHRLSLARRAYEYDHHYGIGLYGKAVPEVRGADSRSKFMEAFHNLLNLCQKFYRQDDNTTVVADGFPMLNGLKEVHLLLTQGQHNQYGDLPWNARLEMLMQQWLLSRPEMREFLTGRIMVAYPEPWMERVDTMKKLQGWTDTPITHFRDLAVFGEKILLSARFGAWIEVFEPDQAANWARYWRPEIQSYMHAYRAATGVDLTSEPVDSAMPTVHLRRRLEQQAPRPT